MHRIDQMIQEVVLTLERHCVAEDGLVAILTRETEAEVKRLRIVRTRVD